MPVWKITDRLLTGERTLVMAILNVTPDSFSDGGRYLDPEQAVTQACRLQVAGADILDIGAQSTRPGHTPVSAAEEWERLSPVLTALKGRLHIPVSVDTFYPEVARRALATGVQILNDVSGSMENGFPALAAATGAGLVMMHTGRGGETVADVSAYFSQALAAADAAGLDRRQICLDVGIGFGKSRGVDLELVSRLPELVAAFPDHLLMVGASRKRVIAHFTGDPPADRRLGGTVALHTLAQLGGAGVLRVHDVEETVQAVRLTDAYMKVKGE